MSASHANEMEAAHGNTDFTEHTIRATDQAVRTLIEYLIENGRPSNFEDLSAEDLNETFRGFFAGMSMMRKKDGTMYKTSSLCTLRSGLSRHVGRVMGLNLDDQMFASSNSVYKTVMAGLKREESQTVSHYPPISAEDISRLYKGSTGLTKHGVFDTDTPAGLQNKVWFELMLFMFRIGREHLRQMTKTTFSVTADKSGRRYVYLPNSDDGNKAHLRRMYDKPWDIVNCPVASYEKYVSKLCPHRDDLWQRPSSGGFAGPKYPEVSWYTNSPVGKNTLSNMMATISKSACLSMIYTNRSIRATNINVLDVLDVSKVVPHHSETVDVTDKHHLQMPSKTHQSSDKLAYYCRITQPNTAQPDPVISSTTQPVTVICPQIQQASVCTVTSDLKLEEVDMPQIDNEEDSSIDVFSSATLVKLEQMDDGHEQGSKDSHGIGGQDRFDDSDESCDVATPNCERSPASSTCISTSPRPTKRARVEKANSQDQPTSSRACTSSSASTPNEGDDLHRFLLSMGETIRKFPARVQADIKFRFYQMIHETEMEILYPDT